MLTYSVILLILLILVVFLGSALMKKRLAGQLAAARALWAVCPEEAALFFWEGRYWLSLPAGEEQTACRLSEFGAEAEQAPFLDARLTEHARLILPRQALATLHRYFPD